MKTLKYILIVIVTLASIVGIGICLYFSFAQDLSANESLMVGILVTLFSILISWILTHVYSQANLEINTKEVRRQYEENIRTYAIKAAEKVFNLSNELSRLIEVLQNTIEEQDEDCEIETCILVLKEKIISTIHLVETLKSMNDTFLSDWRGVIGDEIEKQKQLENQIETLEEEQQILFERLNFQLAPVEEILSIKKSMMETERRLENKIQALPFKIQKSSPKTQKKDIVVECPECEEQIPARIRLQSGVRKLLQCSNCQRYFSIQQLSDRIREVLLVPIYSFLTICPICSNDFKEELPDWQGAMKRVECEKCGFPLIISKTADDVNTKVYKPFRRKITEKLINLVFEKLPERPWPTEIHKEIAKELGLSNSMVTRAINHLINSGKIQKPSIEDGASV